MEGAAEPVPVPRRARWFSVAPDAKRLSGVAFTVLAAYPLGLVSAIYGSWLVAWGVLGRRPVPWTDDPTEISPVVTGAYRASGLVFVGFPAAALLGLGAAVWFGRAHRLPSWATLVLVVLLAALWTGTIAFLRGNVLDVVRWWTD
jgi:hypothetical protein